MSTTPPATSNEVAPDFLRAEPMPAPGTSKPDTAGHIVRPLPVVKTVEQAWRARGEKLAAAETGTEALASLLAYNQEVLDRHAKVAKFFDTQLANEASDSVRGILAKLDPTRDVEYQKFIRDHLSLINGRYATLGIFLNPRNNLENPTATTPADLITSTSTSVSRPADTELTPMLANMQAAVFALENGADLVGANEEP